MWAKKSNDVRALIAPGLMARQMNVALGHEQSSGSCQRVNSVPSAAATVPLGGTVWGVG